MKKVKTIILSFLIVVGTAFMSACSCGSSGDAPVIPEKEITISCNEYTGSSVTITSNTESKELDIKCNVGDTFTIEYLLSPDTATTTTVRWEITDDKDTSDVVKTENTRLTEYSKTVKEKVTFIANDAGDATIRFISESNKTAVANIRVGKRLANLPTLGRVELDTITYNTNNSTLSWTEPTKMITTLGQVVDISDEAKADISHYEVVVTNLDTEKSETLNIGKNVRKITTLENGVRYSVTIKPIGGSFAVASGAESDPFKVCQLSPATGLSNSNGTLSFQTPKYSEDHLVYSNDTLNVSVDDIRGNSLHTMNCSELKNYTSIRALNISVKSFPALYDEDLGYGRCVNTNGELVDDVRYYPSNKCASISVLKLDAPKLTLEDYTGTLTINDISTVATMGTSLMIDKDVNQNYTDYGAYYQLTIKRRDVNGLGELLNSAKIEPSISKTYNLTNVLSSKLNGGNQFEISVQMKGNDSTTINSPVTTFYVTIPVNTSGTSWSIENNYLITSSDNTYAGLELYFVDETNNTITTKTVEKVANSNAIDLQSLGVTPGEYKLFGRFIGTNENNGTIAGSVSPDPFDSSNGVPIVSDDINIYIPQGISSYNATSSGDFVITKPSANNDNSIYQLTLTPEVGGGVNLILYNKDDSANLNKYREEFNVGVSDGTSTTGIYGYTLESSQIKFNLMTAIKEAFSNGDEYFDSLFSTSYTFTFTTKAYRVDGEDIIEGVDSLPSNSLKLSRLSSPQEITFNNNVISFAKIAGASSYTLYVNDGNDTYEVSGIRASGDSVQIDIATTNIKGSTTTKLSSILNNISVDDNVSITYKAIGSNASSGGGELVLDSPVNTVYYTHSTILNNVTPTLDVAGNISWTTSLSLTGEVSADSGSDEEDQGVSNTSTYEIKDTGVKYIIYFYNSNGDVVRNIPLTPTILADGESLAEGYCSVIPKGSQGNDSDILSANILSIIQSILNDSSPICSVEIKEYDSTKFMGAGTIRYYISTLAQTVPTYGIDGEDNVITWESVEGADSYDVFVNDSTTPINKTTNYILLSDLCTNRGVYTIRVMAKANNEEGVGSEDNPFYIYGAEGIVSVNIISAQINASANNTAISQVSDFDSDFIIWNNICTSGTYYTISINGTQFVLTSEDGTPSVLTSGEQAPFTTSTIRLTLTAEMLECLVAGNNEIVIIPTINFADTGYVLVDTGNLPVNTIRKITTPNYEDYDGTTITAVDGNLVIYTDDDIENLVIKISTDGQYFEQISSANYEVITDSTYATMRTIVLNVSTSGEMYIRIKAVKQNTFYSDYLMYLVDETETPITKLATVSDFSRTTDSDGVWFTWTAVDGVTSYELIVWKTTYSDSTTPEVPEEDESDTEQEVAGVAEVAEEGGEESEDDTIIEDDDTQNVSTSKTIKFTVTKNGNDYTCQVEDGVGNGTASRFLYENGKFKYIFDEKVLFDGKGSGDYHFVIRPLTSTNGYLNGSNSQETTITKLNNDTTISITDGVISISGYKQTGEKLPIGLSYVITPYTEVSGEDGETTTTTGTIGTGTITWGDDYANNQIVTIDLLSVSDGTNFIYTSYDLEYYNFKIQITYLGDGSTSVDSDISSEISLERFETTSLYTKDGVVTIKSVDGATNYLVEIDDGSSNLSYVDVLGTDNETSMTELIASESGFSFSAHQEYTLRVQVKGSKLSSAWSEPFKVIKLGAPTEPTSGKGIYIDDDNGTPRINWANNSQNTYGIDYFYRLIYTSNIGADNYQQLSGVSGTDISDATAQGLLTNLPVGTYFIRLRTNGTTSSDGEIGYLNSDYTTGIPVTYVSETSGLKVSQGQISWSPVSSALYYKVIFDYTDSSNNIKSVTLTSTQTYISTDKIPSDVSRIVNVTVTTVENPAAGIVTDYLPEGEEAYTANKLDVYKPTTAGDFKILNGMLSWTIDLAEIKDFVTTQGITLSSSDSEEETPEDGENSDEVEFPKVDISSEEESGETTTIDQSEEVVKYIIKKIDYNMVDGNNEFDLQISHLWQATLKMNAKSQTITPTYVELLSSDGSVISGAIDNSFTDEYWTDGYKLRYYYDVVTDRYNSNKYENPQTDSSTGYVSGNYSLLVSLVGNSGDANGSSTPVISSSYTSPIEAYKLLSPETYTQLDASNVKYDISTGNIYWSPVNNGLDGDDSANYENYAIEVFNSNTNETSTAYISLDEATKLNENYYYVHVLDLFAVDSIKENEDTRQFLRSDTKYEVRVYASGTVDSSLVATGSKLYLNSNSIDYINEISILDVPADPIMLANNVIWTPATTSTLTRIRVYGPFTTTADGSYLISADEIADMSWASAITSHTLESLTPYDVLDFGFDDDGGRVSIYTLTNKFINGITSDPKYQAGGYIFTLQEIGDNYGVVDSVISKPYAYYKLGQTAKIELGSGDYKGMFVWDEVDYANAYKVQLYKIGASDGEDKEPDELISVRYTSEYYEYDDNGTTKRRYYYDLPDFDYEVTDEFYIIVQACNIAEDGLQYLNIDNNLNVIAHLVDGWFMGDDVMSNPHTRLDVPTTFTITSSGTISWASIENAGTYTVIYNDSASNTLEVLSGIVESTHTIVDDITGQFGIKIRTIVKDNNTTYLNSRRSDNTPLMKLFEPDARINSDGNLTWGITGQTGVDANFYSQLIINYTDANNKITVNGNTADNGTIYDVELNGLSIKYFTDLNQFPTSLEDVVVVAEEGDEEGGDEGTTTRTPEDVINEYSYANDLIKYPLGEEKFSMQYVGNILTITIQEGENNSFMISSPIDYITTYKLPAPTNIDFAEIDLTGGTNPVNRLYWSPVENASDYNVFRFAVATDGSGIVTYSKKLVEKVTTDESKYKFMDNLCYYDITDMLVGGANNYFFVQSVGGEKDGVYYINSSYSDKKVINTPATPINLNIANGQMTWEVDSPNVYNIGVILEYTLSNITQSDYDSYWSKTLTTYTDSDKITLNSEIKSRTLADGTSYDSTTQTLSIVERILLESKNYGSSTPTYYKLNAIANYTRFTIFALAGTNLDSPTYKSLDLIRESDYDFAMFASGDGSVANAYIITSEIQLTNIKYFKERAFKLDPVEDGGVKKITLGNNWSAILGDFTGSIDGNGTTIANYRMLLTQASNTRYIMAFVENNLGTIENITFEMLGVGVTAQQEDIRISTVAVTNSGTISNVTVAGTNVYNNTDYHMYVETKDLSESGVKVGGLVVENTGTIDSANINMNIYAIAQDGNLASVGGIAYKSTGGSISNSTFIGDIKGHYIGGIVYEANNVTTISNCTVGSESDISNLTGQAYYGNYGKTVQVGGLIGFVVASSNVLNIENCYTYVNIILDVKSGQSSGAYYLGGMIGLVYDSNTKNTLITNSGTSIKYSYIGTADITTLINTIRAYLFSSSSKVECSGECWYKNRTTGTFTVSNDIPNGVYQKTN